MRKAMCEKMYSKLLLVMALVGSMTFASAGAEEEKKGIDQKFKFSGYMRAATGINTRGGTAVCFKLPDADTKFRLGNECDYVIQPQFDARVASYDGSDWHVHVTPEVYRSWGQTEFQKHQQGKPANTVADTDTLVVRFGQAYVYGKNLPGMGEGTLWLGRRAVDADGGFRLMMTDYLVEKMYYGTEASSTGQNYGSSDGIGIEDAKIGIGLFSAALMVNGLDAANNSRIFLPLKLTNIPTVESGGLSVYVTGSTQFKSKDQVSLLSPTKDPSGYSVGVYQSFKGTIFGGDLMVGAKYDNNHQFDVIDDLGTLTPTRNARLIVDYHGRFGEATEFFITSQFRKKTKQGVNSKWLSAGFRTDTRVVGPYRVLFETGHDQVNPENGPRQDLTKITLAGAISGGKEASSRPTIRVFITHALWNEAARQVLGNGWVNEARLQQVFGDQKSATSIGAQFETWW